MSSLFTHPEIPVWLKVQLILAIPFAGLRGAIASINTRRSWKRSVHLAIVREVLRLLAPVASKLDASSTSDTYRSWASARQLPIFSEDSGEDGRLHWIGKKQLDSKVLLWFHGGGYASPATDDCYNAVLAFKQDTEAAVGGLGVAFLEYSLIPATPFPAQLRQATAALTYLLFQGVSPSNIVLGGDSAGGNLVLQLCSHILHPLPDFLPPPPLASPLAGIVLVSPWTSFHGQYNSFKTNALEDVLSPNAFIDLGKTIALGITKQTRYHLEPATASHEWWAGIRDVAPRVLVTMGEKECLFDQDVEIAENLASHTQVEKVVQIGGVHEDFIFAFGVGAEEGRAGDDYQAVVTCLRSIFK